MENVFIRALAYLRMRNYWSPRTYRDASQQQFASRPCWKDYVIPAVIALGAGVVACTGCSEAPRGLERTVIQESENTIKHQRLPPKDFTAQYALDYQAE